MTSQLTHNEERSAYRIAQTIHEVLSQSKGRSRQSFLERITHLVAEATEQGVVPHRRLHGLFNQLDANNHIIPLTRRSLGSLVGECLEAMGCERQVRGLPSFEPNAITPPVSWDNTLPLVALHELAATAGYRLVCGEGSMAFVKE